MKNKEKEIKKCDGCGSESEELKMFDDKSWCPDCLSENTTICADCGERIYTEDARYVGDDPICESCYDDNYFECEGCERCHHNDDYGEDGYCRNCMEDNKPEIKPDNRRYYQKSRRDLPVGVEIEAEEGDYNNVYDNLADYGFGVQSDGSLDNSGIEIQVPASNGGKTYKLVQKACQSLEKNGFTISKRCGLHVHIEFKSRFKTIKQLLLMIYACEPVFYAINPHSRQENNFCQPINKTFTLAEILKTKVYYH